MFKHGIAPGFVAGQTEKARNGHGSLAAHPLDAYCRVERSQRDGHIRGVRCDAHLRGAQDGEIAMIASARGAAASRFALVTWLGDILEIDAARSLEQVPTCRRQVTQLAGSPGEQ